MSKFSGYLANQSRDFSKVSKTEYLHLCSRARILTRIGETSPIFIFEFCKLQATVDDVGSQGQARFKFIESSFYRFFSRGRVAR